MTELARRVRDESPEEQLDSDGPSSVDRRQRFAELWPLHALRYAMIVAGVAAWLWEGPAAGGRALAVALLISLVMLAELGLYGPRPTRLYCSRRGRNWLRPWELLVISRAFPWF